jgi:hypothetical protein
MVAVPTASPLGGAVPLAAVVAVDLVVEPVGGPVVLVTGAPVVVVTGARVVLVPGLAVVEVGPDVDEAAGAVVATGADVPGADVEVPVATRPPVLPGEPLASRYVPAPTTRTSRTATESRRFR